MTSFTFPATGIRSAPPEARRWMQDEIASALLGRPETGADSTALAGCTPDEALGVFERIRGNFAVVHVFLELALAAPVPGSNLYALEISRIQRRTQLNEHRLLDCFATIGEAFQQLQNDPAVALLGFDENGHVFTEAATNHSVRKLWQELVARASITSTPESVLSSPDGFVPPQLGPSETVTENQGA